MQPKCALCITGMLQLMDPKNEARLIEQCRTDPAAFGQVFDLWYNPVFGYIMRRTADYDLSKDIAAETFLKAFLKINSFQWRGISLSAWLFRIATNELNQYYRSSRYKPQSLQQLLENPQMEKLLHEQDDDEREVMEKELRGFNDYNLIRSNLLKMDVKYQEVIALRYFEQKTNGEISAILNKNEGTVKSLLSRGLEKLRNML
ncbi:RNA polymerase sigma factor [Mucilaginibacter sp.]|uniref:RNA polymerase sigma factor n=1 Tax=Mucilaginibacter sp. TaxID=1882438 RepID=UPI002614A04F|nr:RNA polymerase sigma factor [Mucilaginibacter sp.]